MTGIGAWLIVDPEVAADLPGPRRTVALVRLSPDAVSAVLGTKTAPDPLDSELVRLVGEGHTQAHIARLLNVSLRTVERRLERLRQEAGVASTTELAAYVARTVP